MPHSSTLPRRQRDLTAAIPRRPRGGPPHLVVDSTGLEAPGEGERKVGRHGADRRRVWRKAHLAADAASHGVRAVETTDHRHGDGGILPDLPAQVPEQGRIAPISGDGAHDARSVHEAPAARRTAPLVPPRRDGKPWKGRAAGAHERDETPRAIEHLGRRPWRRWSGHHRRSLAGTAMPRPERLGGRLAARDPARQAAEVRVRCAVHNTLNRLGTPEALALG